MSLLPLISPSRASVDIVYLGQFGSNASANTYTYSSAPLGDVSVDRIIVVASSYSNYSKVWGSGTVAGVSTTNIINSTDSNFSANFSYAAVPTGTSGDIVSNWVAGSGTATDGGIAVWAVYNSSGTPYASVEDTKYTTSTATLDVSINVPDKGGIIAYTTHRTDEFSGITEDFDVFCGAELWHVGASQNFATGETPRSIVTTTSRTYKRALSCSWGP